MKLFKYKTQYSEIMTLALPIILANAGQVIVQLVDNMMVGRLGAEPLAAVAFGGVIVWTVTVLGLGFSYGLTPLVGEHYARGEHKSASQFLQNSILLNLGVGILLTCFLALIYAFLGKMGQDPKVVEIARPYYIYVALSIIPLMIFGSFKQFMEGVGNTKVAMFITLGTNVLNIIGNYLLIYGKLGLPEMGAAGAGLSTMLSRIAMPLIFIVYLYNKDSYKRYFAFFNKQNFSKIRTAMLSRMGGPIAAQMFMETMAFSITSIMMGWFGAVQLAANQITVSMCNFAFMLVSGITAATTVTVSHNYGRGDLVNLKKVTKAAYHLTLALVITLGAIYIIFGGSIGAIFTNDPAVIAVTATLLVMGGVFQLSDGTQAINLGILRGLQDVKTPMIYAFFAYIVVNIPVGYLCAFVFDMGPAGLWVGFIFGLTLAAVLLKMRVNRMLGRIKSTVNS